MTKKRKKFNDEFIMTLPDKDDNELYDSGDDSGEDAEFDMNNNNNMNGSNIQQSAIMKKIKNRMLQKNMYDDNDVDSESSELEDSEASDDDNDNDEINNNIKKVEEKQEMEEKEDMNNDKKEEKMEKLIATETELNKMRYFSQMNLSRPLQKAIENLGYKKPTPVQSLAIPHALNGSDILISAVTGSGKTAAFLLPILERLLYRSKNSNVTRVLIMTPTRELAAQCQQMAQKLASFTDIRIGLVVGGLSMKSQQTVLKSRPDIIIATPGRLIDHLRNSQSFHLEDIEILILDEADRLLDRGFADELREIVKMCPRQRQSMLFSATLTDEVTELVNLSLNRPKRIVIDPSNTMVTTLIQEFIRIRQGKEDTREAIITSLCKRTFYEKTIIFFRSKFKAHRMMIIFGFLGLKAAELHGNLTQLQRLQALEQFRDEHVNYLLCTDLAARGLDIQGVETVINMDLPYDIKQYIHRVGRTARAGKNGRSVTLVGQNERKMMKTIVQTANNGNSKEVVKSRTVPTNIINKYKSKIEGLEDDINAVLQEERIEKEMRIAEMEANKAQNLYVHQDEIYARPQRTWFQTQADKKASKLQSLQEYQGEKPINEMPNVKKRPEKLKKKDPLQGLSRRKKRKKLMKMEMEKEARERKRALNDGHDAKNLAFTMEQKIDRGTRLKKAEINRITNDEDQEHEMSMGAPRYAWQSKKSEFDQRYNKVVKKQIAKSNVQPRKKKVKTSKAKHRRRKGK